MSTDWARLPSYIDLPVDPSKPPRSAWGVFGENDELGTINLLTPECVRYAASLVRTGQVFPLNWNLEMPDPPVFGRGKLRHTVKNLGDGTDDFYDNFHTQASSQWDALSHISHPEHGFYNGRTLADVTAVSGSRNGIDNWARHGIVGRWILADVDRYRREQGRPLVPDAYEAVDVGDVEAALVAQDVQIRTGDILLLRFGWIAWYESTGYATRAALAATPFPGASPGLAPEERTAEWLWNRHVAAVAADSPAVEAVPFETKVDGFLHYRVIPLLGLALGEMFQLDALAESCAADGVYEGFFCAAPLNKTGGSGSPANAVAIK
jgi:kynurenine formamidase